MFCSSKYIFYNVRTKIPQRPYKNSSIYFWKQQKDTTRNRETASVFFSFKSERIFFFLPFSHFVASMALLRLRSNPIILISNFISFDRQNRIAIYSESSLPSEGKLRYIPARENRSLLIPNNLQERPLENELETTRGNRFSPRESYYTSLLIPLQWETCWTFAWQCTQHFHSAWSAKWHLCLENLSIAVAS